MKNLQRLITITKRTSPQVYWISLFFLFLIFGCILGLIIDERTLLGVNVWLKPLKFTISGLIFIMTYGFLISLYPYSKRKINILTGITAWAMLLEILIIICQGARGVQSHYNISTPFDALLFSSLGILISINVLLIVVMAIDAMRLKLECAKSIQWSIVLAWLIVLYACAVGGQMIGQMSHNVGVADGRAGLPLVNWSTIAGDLRISHFFGLHAIQIIPIFAFFISKMWKDKTNIQIAAVTIFAFIYSAWIGFTFYQAKQGIALLGFQ